MFNRTPNTIEKTVTKGGAVKEESTTTFDPYADLVKDGGQSTVSCTYALGIDHNSEKVSFHVTVRCDQTEACINEAGKRAFLKAHELTQDAIGVLGWNRR